MCHGAWGWIVVYVQKLERLVIVAVGGIGMDAKKKKQINDAIKLMKSICYKYDVDGCCNADCPLWWNCGTFVYDMRQID